MTSRLHTPASIDESPAAAKPFLEAVKKQLGVVPNLFRLVANSPAALEGYLGLNGALGKGQLDARTRERIALAVAEIAGGHESALSDPWIFDVLLADGDASSPFRSSAPA